MTVLSATVTTYSVYFHDLLCVIEKNSFSWETSTFKNYHSKDSRYSGSRRLQRSPLESFGVLMTFGVLSTFKTYHPEGSRLFKENTILLLPESGSRRIVCFFEKLVNICRFNHVICNYEESAARCCSCRMDFLYGGPRNLNYQVGSA